MDFLEKENELIFSFIHLSISKLLGFGQNPFFFLSELQEEAEINISKDVEYVPEDQGM